MLQITNNGDTRARVFGPTGAVIGVEPGETIEIGFTEDEIKVEQGGDVTIKQKAVKQAKAKDKGE